MNRLSFTADERAAHKKTRESKISDFIAKNTVLGKYIAELMPTYRNLFCSVFLRESSRTQAIKAKCLECTAFQKTEITDCHLRQCALWGFRPYQEKESK